MCGCASKGHVNHSHAEEVQFSAQAAHHTGRNRIAGHMGRKKVEERHGGCNSSSDLCILWTELLLRQSGSSERTAEMIDSTTVSLMFKESKLRVAVLWLNIKLFKN